MTTTPNTDFRILCDRTCL